MRALRRLQREQKRESESVTEDASADDDQE